MLNAVTTAIRLLRPRTIAGLLQARDTQARDLATTQDALRAAVELAARQARALDTLRLELEAERRAGVERAAASAAKTKALEARLDAVALREQQLRAVLAADVATDAALPTLETILDTSRVAEHVQAAVDNAPLCTDPFPHVVVDRILPTDFYDALIAGLPPAEVFAERPPNKRQVGVPFPLASIYGRRVWDFMMRHVTKTAITRAAGEKLREPLSDWLRFNFPDAPAAALADIRLRCSDGRILLRTRGYRIRPHRDPAGGFLTCLLYLARPGDDEAWGTSLYAVENDQPARNTSPHWVADAQCRLVKDVTFQPNRALIWLNSVGAHGAVIPDDAPDGLQRYAFQCRIGLPHRPMEALIASLPSDRQAAWRGKGEY